MPVLDPSGTRFIGLVEGVSYILLPSSVVGLKYPTYEREDLSWIGRVGYFFLQRLIILSTIFNTLLTVPMLVLVILSGIVMSPFMVPHWIKRYAMKRRPTSLAERLEVPLYVRLVALLGQSLIWLLFAPVKLTNIMALLTAYFLVRPKRTPDP